MATCSDCGGPRSESSGERCQRCYQQSAFLNSLRRELRRQESLFEARMRDDPQWKLMESIRVVLKDYEMSALKAAE